MTERGVNWNYVYGSKAIIEEYNGGDLWYTHVSDKWGGEMVKYDIETKTKHILYFRDAVQFLRKDGEIYMFQVKFRSKDRDKIENMSLKTIPDKIIYTGRIIDLDIQ